MPDLSEKKSLTKLIEAKRILICCGSGGVGKTTTAAAIALKAAVLGYKTIVLTIDPAKRLANSLGIEKIDYQEKELPKAELKKAGVEVKAPLYAMMLDTKRTFDSLILKYAPTPERAQGILDNKLYQHLSNMIAGSQEYMAMEKLYEVAQERDYDLILLDTPPSRHALDFLDAPEKMKRMIGDSIMNWFLKPSLFISKAGLRFLDNSMRRVFQSFDKVAGFEFLQDLSAMLVATSGLLGGFQERAEKVAKILHDEKTSFLLIAAPQPIPLHEAEFFYRKIKEYQLPFSGFIFNRVQFLPEESENTRLNLTTRSGEAYQEMVRLFKKLYQRDRSEIIKFKEKMHLHSEKLLFKVVPQLDHDVHDLHGLNELGESLLSEEMYFQGTSKNSLGSSP